jgi:hypothetical protein
MLVGASKHKTVSNLRRGIITLVPASSQLVALERALCVAEIHLVQLAQVLLVRSSAAEVTLGAVSVDGHVQTPGGGLGIVLAVGLEGVDEGVCGVIGLLELLGLDLCGLLKGLAGFDIF